MKIVAWVYCAGAVTAACLYSMGVTSGFDARINTLADHLLDTAKTVEFLKVENFKLKKEIEFLHEKLEYFPR